MADRWLACLRCGAEFDLGPYFSGCPVCSSELQRTPLEVRYDLGVVARALDRSTLDDVRGDVWRFSPLQPLRDLAHAVSLGEGGTPLVRQAGLSTAAGVAELFLKNESHNPTWSYKDRFNAVTVSVASELGFAKIASASTGNQGASVAAYATAKGMRCMVFLPDETPELLRDLIQAYGARAIVTRWHARGALLETLVSEHSWFPSSTLAPMPVGSPYGVK